MTEGVGAVRHRHLLDWPYLHCFRSERVRDASVALALRTSGSNVLSGGYVTAWQDQGSNGPSVTLSADVNNLGAIGWNDRITSFKAFSGASGRFYEHAGYTGNYFAFCCASR
jgi:hypothetical protein